MKIVWVRGHQDIPLNRPHTDFIVSPIRGGGKSSFLEHRAENYMKKGNTVLDFFGSRDSEGLAWARNPLIDGVGQANGEKKICLLHSDNVTIDSSLDQCPMSRFSHSTLAKYDVVVSASALHKSLDDEYKNVNTITDLLYDRGLVGYKKLVVGVIREASNLYYSRLRVSSSQTMAKAYMIYLIREARHMGLALCMDTLKMTSIDLDIRVLVDNTIFKGQGYIGLPDDLKFVYRYFDPAWMRNMKPWEFVILTKEANLGLGIFREVKWHKQERENILTQLDIRIIEHEGMDQSVPQGSGLSISTQEHIKIIEATCPNKVRVKHEIDEKKTSMRGLAKQMGRSFNTIVDHQGKHDDMIAKIGYCPDCRRGGGRLYMTIIKKFDLEAIARDVQAKMTVT